MQYFAIFLSLFFLSSGCSSNNPSPFDDSEIGVTARGCIGTEYPDWKSSPYVLPYPVGKAYGIDLSNCSGSFHGEGRPDEFAIDFNMAIGTPVTASREGTVYSTEERFTDAGDGTGNLVTVDHGDSTFGVYLHFTQNGVEVEVGQKVKKGDLLGYSGSSGLAGYPHLHLVIVTGDPSWPYTSIPVTFSNTVSNERSLASGYSYEAFPY